MKDALSEVQSDTVSHPQLSPFARLVIVGGITFGVILFVVLSIIFRQDPFTNDLQNSESMKITTMPKSLPSPISIQ